MANQGGSHEQHVKAGQQSHKGTQQASGSKSTDDRDMNKGSQGKSNEQQSKGGQQGHKGH